MYAHIIYFNYLKADGSEMSIGGIQTYISNLIPVLQECGYKVIIYQRAEKDFHRSLDNCEVYGVSHPRNHCPQAAKALLEKALPNINVESDLLVYGCETCITKAVKCRTIAIQHGIFWDVPYDQGCSDLKYMRHYLGKCYRAWKICQRVSKVDKLVCVDHNFVNWHRAITSYPRVEHLVIPNFSSIPPREPKSTDGTRRIIFARRFFPHRGTRLFTNVATRLLAEYPKIDITIAGTGPDADYIHKKLDGYANVRFITYDSKDSLLIHSDKDIAVVPTIGSEGTSLSLIEAMASGCAVVCTNVGGMTNIVLDGYNGLMISPDEDALYTAIKRLIDDDDLCCRLQQHAYETANEAFSVDVWRQRWKRIITNI